MPKYDSLRKTARNAIIMEYAKAHPDLSLKEIGEYFNLSASQVCRILKPDKVEAK